MKKFFKALFNDNNSINEKAIIGFASFIIMCIFATFDIVTGLLNKELVIQEFVFNSFLWLTLGCFGIASVDKFINKDKSKDEESTGSEYE